MILNHYRYTNGFGADGFCACGASSDAFIAERGFNHDVKGKNRLLAQYRDKDNFLELFGALLSSCQSIEDAMQRQYQSRGLDGFGSALDGIGGMFLFPRDGARDNQYRHLLAGRVVAAASDATPEAVREVIDTLLCGNNHVNLEEHSPGVTVIKTRNLQQKDGEMFARILAKAPPAGTRVILEWQLPAYIGPTVSWDGDNAGSPLMEWGANPFAEQEIDESTGIVPGYWAEASDGRGT